MAISKFLIASFLLSTLVLHVVQAMPPKTPPSGTTYSPAPGPQTDYCDASCAVRCSKSSRPDRCKRACGSCCDKCKCVPPGTYGNYDACPCYARLTTHGGKLKCP